MEKINIDKNYNSNSVHKNALNEHKNLLPQNNMIIKIELLKVTMISQILKKEINKDIDHKLLIYKIKCTYEEKDYSWLIHKTFLNLKLLFIKVLSF